MINKDEKNNNQIEQLELQIEQKFFDTSCYVYKSHNLIESNYNFSINEQRLIYLASKKLKPRYIKSDLKTSQLKTYIAHKTFENIRIYVTEFKNEFNIKSNAIYKILEKTAADLFEKKFEYMQDDSTYVTKRWVITCRYNSEEKYVEITFHPDLILDLLLLKNRYGKLEFSAARNFKKSYTHRIYELLQNYLYQKYRTISLESLKEKLDIEPTKYQRFTILKEKVLEPAIEEINKFTNLQVSYTPLRKGRKIGAVKFSINLKETETILSNINDEKLEPEILNKITTIINSKLKLTNKLEEYQISQIINESIAAIKEYKIDMSLYEYVEYQVNNVYNYSRVKKVNNYFSCLITAIRSYWKENEEINNVNENKFNNFTPREYDYDKLEKQLLGWEY